MTQNELTVASRVKPRRVSLAMLLGLVAALGFLFAAVRGSTVLWAGAVATLGIVALLTSVLGFSLLRGRSRAFCLGFATFAGTFFVLMQISWFWPKDTLWGTAVSRPMFEIALLVHPEQPPQPGNTDQQIVEAMTERQERRRSCHTMLDWIAVMTSGLLGGGIGLGFAAMRARDQAPYS